MSPRRPFPLTATIPALACALVLLAGTPAWASDSPAEFKGKIGKTLADSEEYWPPPVTPPEGAPNVLIWLIDDMGYGHSSAFGGLTPMPTIERLAARGLRYTNFHTTALCSPSRASIAAGRNHHNFGMGSHSLTAMGFPGYNAHPPDSAKGFSDVTGHAGADAGWYGRESKTLTCREARKENLNNA
jgi:arylsulfatase